MGCVWLAREHKGSPEVRHDHTPDATDDGVDSNHGRTTLLRSVTTAHHASDPSYTRVPS